MKNGVKIVLNEGHVRTIGEKEVVQTNTESIKIIDTENFDR